MNKKTIVFGVVLAVIGAVAVGAYYFPKASNTIVKEVVKEVRELKETLGGITSYDTLSLRDFFSYDDTGFATSTALSDITFSGKYFEHASVGTCADATTTLIVESNPFYATSTARLSRFEITGAATSSFALNIGTSTNAYATSSGAFVDRLLINANQKAYLFSGVATTTEAKPNTGTASTTNMGPVALLHGPSIIVGPDEVISATAQNAAAAFVSGGADPGIGRSKSTLGITSSTNTFTCDYSIIWEH